MEALQKPQVVVHISKSLNYTAFDIKWIPCSTKFVVLGSHPRGTGAIQVYDVCRGDAKLVSDVSSLNSTISSYNFLKSLSC